MKQMSYSSDVFSTPWIRRAEEFVGLNVVNLIQAKEAAVNASFNKVLIIRTIYIFWLLRWYPWVTNHPTRIL